MLYPGSPQALGFGELGAHGTWRFQVDNRGISMPKQMPLSCCRYEDIGVDITDAENETELERLVINGQINHGGHAVLRWMAGNVTVKMDPAGNIKPDKQRSSEKIDGVVALIMAIGRAMFSDRPQRSVYESRGVLII